ncbi:MAG: polysaccharide deacetylase family protein [Erythrobacter sp.]
MTRAYITIDTEYSSGFCTGRSRADRAENYARCIACLTPDGAAGITHKLELLAQHGQKAVFFVDPMPALIWGIAAIEDIVGPIIAAGQDVQLHCHTEWLAIAGADNPLASGRTGQNIADFPLDEQFELLAYARDALIAAGAPPPVAFRAGNYGANDDTLRVLAGLGLTYDTSHTPALPDACRISLGPEVRDPVEHCGIIEVPVGTIGTLGGGQRHAQITALTLAEMIAALRHARNHGRDTFVLVSHSFELINRRSLAVNHVVHRRFTRLVREIAVMRGIMSANFRDDPPTLGQASIPSEPVPATALRTGMRLAEQFVSNTLYGAR